MIILIHSMLFFPLEYTPVVPHHSTYNIVNGLVGFKVESPCKFNIAKWIQMDTNRKYEQQYHVVEMGLC